MQGARAWLLGRVPTREALERNRLARPFAPLIFRAELWRMTRRSVPRGIALGLFVGVMIPFAHFIVAMIVAAFVRANIPAALAATFIGFPVIYVALVAFAYRLGEWLLHLDAISGIQPFHETMQTAVNDHLLQHLTGAGLDTAVGLFIIASGLAVAGHALASVAWRLVVARKRRLRLEAARSRIGAAPG